MTNQSNNPIKAASGGDYVRGGRLSGCRLYSNKRRRIDNLEACQSQSWHAKPSAFGAARFLAAHFIKLPPVLASLSLSFSFSLPLRRRKKNVSIYRRCLPAARLCLKRTTRQRWGFCFANAQSRSLDFTSVFGFLCDAFSDRATERCSLDVVLSSRLVKCKLASPVRRPIVVNSRSFHCASFFEVLCLSFDR